MEKTKSETIIAEAPPFEGTYAYIAVKGSLHAVDCSIFGLSDLETVALQERYPRDSGDFPNSVHLRGPVINVINSLAELGYRVIASSGENEITWTLQREI